MKVDNFQDGDLGLNFTAINRWPEVRDLPTTDGENRIVASWVDVNSAMSQFVLGARIVNLESPGDPVAGSASANNFFPDTFDPFSGGQVGPGAAGWLAPWPGPTPNIAPQAVSQSGAQIDTQVSQLVQAMAAYTANDSGFESAISALQAAPNEAGVRDTIAAALHA